MKKVTIKKIDNKLYTLIDNNNNIYNITIEFFDIDELPKENDIIHISDNLLDKKYKEYSNFYSFGSLKSKYGREIINGEDTDIIKLETNGKSYYLKRLYG